MLTVSTTRCRQRTRELSPNKFTPNLSRPKRSSDRDTLLRIFKRCRNQTKPHKPINWTIQKSSTLKRKSKEESSILNSSMSTQEQDRRTMKKPTILSMKEKPFDDNQDKDDVDNPDEEDIDDNVEVSIVEMLHLFSTSDVPDNDTTKRQRIAFNKLAFGYREDLDIFPEPSQTSKQFTDEKFNNTMMLMQKLTSDNVSTKKKALKELRMQGKLMVQFIPCLFSPILKKQDQIAS
jgi:hypothetical protein